MLCCCDPFEPLQPEEEAAIQRKLLEESNANNNTGVTGSSSSLGNTLQRTGPPTTAATVQGQDPPTQSMSGEDDLVSVTVPHGVASGHNITVRSPDGLRSVCAVVPWGLQPGDSFLVKFPSAAAEELAQPDMLSQGPTRSFVQALDEFFTPKPDLPVATAMPAQPAVAPIIKAASVPGPPTMPHITKSNTGLDPVTKSGREPQASPSKLLRIHNDKPLTRKIRSEPIRKPEPVGNVETSESDEEELDDDQAESRHDSSTVQSSEVGAGQPKPKPEQEGMKPKIGKKSSRPSPEAGLSNPVGSGQKLLLVQVPMGVSPGSIIHVEVPGENRTLEARVPPGVTSFHVAYTPRGVEVQRPAPELVGQPPTPHRMSPSTRTDSLEPTSAFFGGQQPAPHRLSPPGSPRMRASQPSPPRQRAQQKLILVRVPPGTSPGSTLHVSVPDEPGRILAARVPPGQVREFHVAYEPRTHHDMDPTSPKSPQSSGMLPPANPYAQGGRGSTPYHYQSQGPPPPLPQLVPHHYNRYHAQHSYGYGYQQGPPGPYGYPNPYGRYSHPQRYDSAPTNYMMPMVGAAAMGMAGVATYDHFHHNATQQQQHVDPGAISSTNNAAYDPIGVAGEDEYGNNSVIYGDGDAAGEADGDYGDGAAWFD